nr:CoA transferase [Pseudomonas sp.]
MPLAGVRVIEICNTIAGPACGRLLADFGADVIKIEPPDGDPVRQMGSHVDDIS